MFAARIERWIACAVLQVVLSLTASVPAAAQEESGWKQLNLRETVLAGTKVLYEQSLEPNLPALERSLAKLVEGRENLAKVLSKRQEILAEINRILGVSEPDIKDQNETLTAVGGTFSRTKLTFYFVTKPTLKDFLRRGGRLPYFDYDRQTDIVNYSPQLFVPYGAKSPETWEMCILMPEENIETFIVQGLGRFFGCGTADIAIHEVTELTLLRRARPADPYWRWFSDGFANAITHRLVGQYVGPDAAKEFASAYDPNRCADLRQEANLSYWMLGNYTVYTARTSVKAESSLQQARYTYAMFEAQRLIDRHGIDCVRKILDEVTATDSRRSSDLLEAIRKATGEDMRARLADCQTFRTRTEGGLKYAAAFRTAQQQKNLEQMFVNLLRVMEVMGDIGSLNYLRSFQQAAQFLALMGHEEEGDEAMRRAIDLYSKGPGKQGRLLATEAFVVYALECRKPRKAAAAAEELLADNPRNVWGLTIKMLLATEDRTIEQAKEYARQIESIASEQSPPYQLAARVLAIDPNAPGEYKGLLEPK
jgi:hypothetical protein